MQLKKDRSAYSVRPEKLARRNATLSGTFDVSLMPRLLESCHGSFESEISYELTFYEESGIKVDCSVKGCLELTCQRCLEACEYEVNSFNTFYIVGKDIEGCDKDLLITKNGFMSTIDLVEDETILALPLVSMHQTPCVIF